jgi:antitoxin component of MazEF toxin-antitoxin module
MVEIKTKFRRMGNSLGIIVPAEIVNTKGFREGEDVSVNIEEKGFTTIGDMLKEARKQNLKFTKSTQEIMDEINRALEPQTFD